MKKHFGVIIVRYLFEKRGDGDSRESHAGTDAATHRLRRRTLVVVVFVGCHDVDASRKEAVGTGVEDEGKRGTKEVVFSEGTGC